MADRFYRQKNKPDDFEPGQRFEVEYPFVLETYTDNEGETLSWKPGIEFVANGPEDFDAIAHAMGKQLLTVVSVHKPGPFPTRVFYQRAWENPKGRAFGKPKLRMTTQSNFRVMLKGYRHPFIVRPKDEVASDPA